MCGIVGLAGDLFHQDETTIKRLIHLDYLRGQDSTGFAAIRNSGEAVIAKIASHPYNLFDTKRFQQALQYGCSKVFLGHNRAATKGAVNEMNAHPFQVGHITGVHNGTLEAKDFTMLEEMLGEKFNVDSEALFAAIAKFGVEKGHSSSH
jgi:glucosamine 6-phosphate synthetase-like amidotransferase/phosphosugar isomerase protein